MEMGDDGGPVSFGVWNGLTHASSGASPTLETLRSTVYFPM